MLEKIKKLWKRLDVPMQIGLSFSLIAITFTVVGIIRDPNTPITAWSLIVGSLIGGLTWGIVSWAIATAAITVEQDVAEFESESSSD
ncbi:MAG: hypothetical protein B6242_01720 [Anaerolineaceae bacterium 4572_78]|nr:MAG: hypothetical protein B6242_01720 [Anaerolineaceae bacterium 4572_78]